MTSNSKYLYDTLSRRMARGAANRGDVPLLCRLLLCQRRTWMTTGLVVGASSAMVLQFVLTAFH